MFNLYTILSLVKSGLESAVYLIQVKLEMEINGNGAGATSFKEEKSDVQSIYYIIFQYLVMKFNLSPVSYLCNYF